MKYAIPTALVATLVIVGVTACAMQTAPGAAAPPKRTCFQANDVAGWKEGDRSTRSFNLRTVRGDVYTSRLMGVCPDIDWTNSIGIKTRTSSFICEGDDATIIVPSSTMGRQTCDIDKIRKLSKEEAAALEKKYKP